MPIQAYIIADCVKENKRTKNITGDNRKAKMRKLWTFCVHFDVFRSSSCEIKFEKSCLSRRIGEGNNYKKGILKLSVICSHQHWHLLPTLHQLWYLIINIQLSIYVSMLVYFFSLFFFFFCFLSFFFFLDLFYVQFLHTWQVDILV